MKINTSISLLLSLIFLSCNKSDDNTTPNVDNDFVKQIIIKTKDYQKLPEFAFFYDTSIDFEYDKQNKPSIIRSAITYRDNWTIDDSGEFANKIIKIQEQKIFSYDKKTHLLLEEKTTSERETRIKTFQYDNFQRIKSIKEDDKESVFTYNHGTGQLASIQTQYTNAENQHFNSIRYFNFDNNNNLNFLVYENNNKEQQKYYFNYTDVKSHYENNAINYTLTDGLNPNIPFGLSGYIMENWHSDFMSNIEYIYKGNLLLDNIKVSPESTENFFKIYTEVKDNSYVRYISPSAFEFFATF
ncbi:hypothetical protein [Myroides odoratus]|uniref:hypothetical protein n=1 Tax=Myroides odoratus TaxID=256 RepID=UPI003341522A